MSVGVSVTKRGPKGPRFRFGISLESERECRHPHRSSSTTINRDERLQCPCISLNADNHRQPNNHFASVHGLRLIKCLQGNPVIIHVHKITAEHHAILSFHRNRTESTTQNSCSAGHGQAGYFRNLKKRNSFSVYNTMLTCTRAYPSDIRTRHNNHSSVGQRFVQDLENDDFRGNEDGDSQDCKFCFPISPEIDGSPFFDRQIHLPEQHVTIFFGHRRFPLSLRRHESRVSCFPSPHRLCLFSPFPRLPCIRRGRVRFFDHFLERRGNAGSGLEKHSATVDVLVEEGASFAAHRHCGLSAMAAIKLRPFGAYGDGGSWFVRSWRL